MRRPVLGFMVIGFCLLVSVAGAATFNVSTPAEFQNALTTAQQNGEDDVINVQADMIITSTLTYTTPDGDSGHTLTIIGNGHSLDGGNSVQIMNIRTDNNVDGGDNGGDIIIKGLTFKNGKSSGDGGGLYVLAGNANIILEDNTFNSNRAGNFGGGAFVDIRSAGFITLTNNTFSLNYSTSWGGGVCVKAQSGTIALTNNTFSSNSTNFSGGGAFVVAILSTATLTNNTFSSNKANDGGGAFLVIAKGTGILANNTFSSNHANGTGMNYGGGLYGELDHNSAKLQVYNNIIWGNTVNYGNGDDIYIYSDGDGSGATVEFYNNDLGPNSDFNSAQSEDLYITNTTNYSHDGNIKDNPQFVDPENKDFHLQATSPCVDAGDNNAPGLLSTDFEGDPRVIDGNQDGNAVVDIGADEFCSECYTFTMEVQGTGSGRVMSSPSGIYCGQNGGSCSVRFLKNTSVTLTASADANSIFSGWRGDCSPCGTNTTCTITMDSDKDCTATFNEIGDVDSDQIVDIIDALLASMNSLGIQVNGGFNFQAADVNRDGNVNIDDAIGIAEMVLGLQGF